MNNIKTFGVISLGCAKNRIDSEEIIALLVSEAYAITADLYDAEIIIINTCSFISDARLESRETITDAEKYKNSGNCQVLLVAGCFAETMKDDILREFPFVDLVVGVHSYPEIPHTIKSFFQKKIPLTLIKKAPNNYKSSAERYLTTSPHSAYLKIADGCDNRCTYCLIPDIRGHYRSRSVSSVLREAEGLAKKGTKEINLVAQDTTFYGKESGGEGQLEELLKELIKIEDISWIRILYAHPAHIEDSLIELIASEEKICSYIDLPLQHISDKILKSMNRHYDKEKVLAILKSLRDKHIKIRSTFIVGFPGENEDDFKELVDFINEHPFERLGVFKYSQEEDTPAFSLKNHISSQVKEQRFRDIMIAQKKISFDLNKRFTGEEITVLVDEKVKESSQKKYYRGRSDGHAPEVDGGVIFSANVNLFPGDMPKVSIIGCNSYDLIGNYID